MRQNNDNKGNSKDIQKYERMLWLLNQCILQILS